MPNKKCIIIADAPETNIKYVKDIVLKENIYVICADGGIKHAEKLGIKPDLIIGDFDSAGKINSQYEIIRLRPEKDDSDTQSCFNEAIKRGYDDITLVCACGGRIDHFLCNISLLENAFNTGIECRIVDSQNVVSIHKGGKQKYKKDINYKYVGIIPIDKEISGVTLQGLKYPLLNVTINRTKIISISNEPIQDEFTIEIKKGRALVIFSN